MIGSQIGLVLQRLSYHRRSVLSRCQDRWLFILYEIIAKVDRSTFLKVQNITDESRVTGDLL